MQKCRVYKKRMWGGNQKMLQNRCLGLSWLSYKTTMYEVAFKQSLISDKSGYGKSKSKAPADTVSITDISGQWHLLGIVI